jgi:hypothetical protein
MAIEFTREKVDRAIELAEDPFLKAKTTGEVQGRATRPNRGAPIATRWGHTQPRHACGRWGNLAGEPHNHDRHNYSLLWRELCQFVTDKHETLAGTFF